MNRLTSTERRAMRHELEEHAIYFYGLNAAENGWSQEQGEKLARVLLKVIKGDRSVSDRAARPRISVEVREAVYSADGHACRQCGSTRNLSLDHIHPYSKGGSDEPANLQTLCMPCNVKKGTRVPVPSTDEA